MSALLIGFARARQNEGRGRQGPLVLKRYIHPLTAVKSRSMCFYLTGAELIFKFYTSCYTNFFYTVEIV